MSSHTYAQMCALATALDVVGDRWALLVVRELLLGPKRFTDLVAGLPGVGTNTLATRLKELESDGIVARRLLPPPAPATVYELTELGRGLEPVVFAFARWGAPLIGRSPIEHPLRADWLGTAMGAFFRPGRASDGVFELVMPTGTVTATVAHDTLAMRNGAAGTPATRVRGNEAAFLAVLLGRSSVADAVRGASLVVEGEVAAFEGLLRACAIGAG
jgi:DNA-binding HxlR family transcriptional regulator